MAEIKEIHKDYIGIKCLTNETEETSDDTEASQTEQP